MESFAKFREWVFNVIGLALIGGLISIKSDLSQIKEQLPLINYRLEQLEQASKSSGRQSNNSTALFKGVYILPDRIKLEERQKRYDYN